MVIRTIHTGGYGHQPFAFEGPLPGWPKNPSARRWTDSIQAFVRVWPTRPPYATGLTLIHFLLHAVAGSTWGSIAFELLFLPWHLFWGSA